MAAVKEKVYTVTTSAGTYRFTDLQEHSTHYSARQVLNGNRIGSMIHRVSKADIARAAITEEELHQHKS
jgi:hypothetical protein